MNATFADPSLLEQLSECCDKLLTESELGNCQISYSALSLLKFSKSLAIAGWNKKGDYHEWKWKER